MALRVALALEQIRLGMAAMSRDNEHIQRDDAFSGSRVCRGYA